MDEGASDSYDEFLFWKEVGLIWCEEPILAEALLVFNVHRLPKEAHQGMLGYRDREQMVTGFLTGIMTHITGFESSKKEIIELNKTPDLISAHDIDRNLIVTGQIAKIGNPLSKIVMSDYECPSCGQRTMVFQDGFKLRIPPKPPMPSMADLSKMRISSI